MTFMVVIKKRKDEMIKAVIFDMDGVLINSEPFQHKADLCVLSKFGVAMSEEECREFVGSTENYTWGILKERHNLPHDVEELTSMKRQKYMGYLTGGEIEAPSNKVIKLLDELQKNSITMAVASSGWREIVTAVIDVYKLGKYFNAVMTGDDVSMGKPDPEIFLAAAKAIDVDPEYCVVIEDARNGVTAAKLAGMKCIGYKNESTYPQDLSDADLVISDLAEIDYKTIAIM
jgi:HAD superfamily hydrolase (TIGR01509 family)